MKKSRLLIIAFSLIIIAVVGPTLSACNNVPYETTTHFYHHIYVCEPSYPTPICSDWFEERGTLYQSCDGTYCDGDCDLTHAAYTTYDVGRQCFCEGGPGNP